MSRNPTLSDSAERQQREVFRRIAEALEPIAPPRARGAALRERVLATVREGDGYDSPEYLTVRESDGRWVEIAPLVLRKTLYRDATGETFLLRLMPGAVLEGHPHPGTEECLVVEGETFLGDVHLRAGDFHLAHAGTAHGVVRSPKGALLYIRSGAGAA